MKKIIENAQNGNIDGMAFRQLIGDEDGQEIVEILMKKNNGKLNINKLLNDVTEMTKNIADSRVKTAGGYMEAAKKDLDARASGIERKVDALTKTSLTSVKRDEAYFDIIDRAYSQGINSAIESENQIKKKISLEDIENATSGVCYSGINSNFKEINNKINSKDNKIKE